MARKFFVFLFMIIIVITTPSAGFSAEGMPELKKGERLFDASYDQVWDATLAVITENGFSVHPHKKWKHKKKKGRIKTPEWRYFKIWSAQPVISKQYKDSYKIKVKAIEIELPQTKQPKEEAVVPKEEAVIPKEEAVVPKEGENPVEGAIAETKAPAVPTMTKIKVSIKRKFLVHNDATRKWDKGDPDKEKAGYSVEYLLEEIAKKLKDKNPTVDPTKIVNLNIAPPPIHLVTRP